MLPVAVQRLFHIALQQDWDRALVDGSYRVSTVGRRLEEEGFIHLSFAHQVKIVADALYRGRTDLVLLELDRDRLSDEVRVEPVPDSTERFPHLYGEIAPGSVVAAKPLVAGPDGRFDPPE